MGRTNPGKRCVDADPLSIFGDYCFLFWKDHSPPHFHARYGGHVAALTFDGHVIIGSLPPKVLSLLQEWTSLHRAELENNWVRMQAKQYPYPIAPLE